MSFEKILVVDDEQFVREALIACLESENMIVTALQNGNEVMPALSDERYDLVILDLMLKDANGLEILGEIKKKFVGQPVIILSAKKELHEKVLGLGLGADDYVTKPFEPPELIARIKAHIRTARNLLMISKDERQVISYHGLDLDLQSFTLVKAGKKITLNFRLFKLLKYFMDNEGKVISKEQIYDHSWNDTYFDENTIKVYVRKLRMLIEDDPDNPRYLHTVWGMGYNFSYKE
jgi:DNA-binding response OmpR family regulator